METIKEIIEQISWHDNVFTYLRGEQWKSLVNQSKDLVRKADAVLKSNQIQNIRFAESDNVKNLFKEADHVYHIIADLKGYPSDNTELILVHSGGTVQIAGQCDCFGAFPCEHIYALLTLLSKEVAQFDDERGKSTSHRLPMDVAAWLYEVERASPSSAICEDEERALFQVFSSPSEQKKNARLLYFLSSERFDYGEQYYNIRFARGAYMGPDKGFKVVSTLSNKPSLTSKYLTGLDKRLVDVICSMGMRDGSYGSAYTLYGEGSFKNLMHEILKSGRLMYEEKSVRVGSLHQPYTMAPESVSNLGWRELPHGGRQPVVLPYYRKEDILSTTPLIMLDKEQGCFVPIVFEEYVKPELVEIWAGGPTVNEGHVELVAEKEVVKRTSSLGHSIEQVEEEVAPTFELRITKEAQRAHYTHLKVALYVNYGAVEAPASKVKKVLDQHLKGPVMTDENDEGRRRRVAYHRSAKAERAALRVMNKHLCPYREVSQWPGEGFYEFHQREYAANLGEAHEFSPLYTPEMPPLAAEAYFYAEVLPHFEQLGWEVTRPEGQAPPVIEELSSEYGRLEHGQGEDGIDWFRFDTGLVNTEGQEFSLYEQLAAYLEHNEVIEPSEIGSGEVTYLEDPMSDGRVYKIPRRIFMELAKKVEDLFLKKGEPLDRLRAAKFADDFQIDTSETLRALAELGRKLKSIKEIPAARVPRNLQAELRSYQLEGYRWLQFLHGHQLNGVLADDMGLGKTLQTITHLLAQKNKGAKHPSLVVAPTSVVSNWKSEVEKFAPKMKVLLLRGAERHEHWGQLGRYDLVITSYALIVRDEERMLEEQFHTVVLDEAQYIKNSKAKVSRVVCKLPSQHRLCLSGTPLENHLGELWSLSRFLMPGLLGDESSFRETYRTPIEKHGERAPQIALSRKVAPLILRRTKEEVVTELPQKTEITTTVTLSQEQTTLYEAIRAAMDEKVRNAIASKGVSQSQIIFLEALMKLRQTCCDPRLLKDGAHKEVPSAKFKHLTQELLPSLLEEGRKILIFSQFTTMLSLIEEHLKQEKVKYTKLTGATRKRDEAIQYFQEGEAQVFLISLKAGGTGLNLTAADTVIHYDPWWNPAAENQATDRAHRMGQTKPVFVYRLICEGSIEERIQELQKQKSSLADSVLSGSMNKISLDQETLGNLLAPLT